MSRNSFLNRFLLLAYFFALADSTFIILKTFTLLLSWFALAERMITRELLQIQQGGLIQNGILNPNDLEPNRRVLMNKYIAYKVSKQATVSCVCIVIEVRERE